ncbi:MAG: transglutaminase-like domain-containing protein [Anaerolineae bacterium]|jgi:transglutaminase-like putative cysteine protease
MRSSRWWDPAAAVLLLLALLTASGRLLVTEWVDHLSVAQTLVFLGTAAGLALGYSIFSPWLAAMFGVLYGVFVIPWQLGITVGHITDDAMWSDRLIVMGERVLNTLREFLQQEPVHDPVLFLFIMAVLSWGLSVYASYCLVRNARPWRIIVPAGLAAVLIHGADPYEPRRLWYLAAYLLFSLLLLSRLTFLHLRSQWRADDARIPPLIGLDMSYVVVAATVVLILVSWVLPAMADVLPVAKRVWDQATNPAEERLDKLFASLERRGATITVSDYYSDEFPLGRGRELSDALVASVQVPADAPSRLRYYWRARVYDHYGDGQWSTGAMTTTEKVRSGTFASVSPELEGRTTITFAFTSAKPIVTLYAAPQPLWASRSVEVDFAPNPDGSIDVASLHGAPPLNAGETYLAGSSVTDATLSELREAGTVYPEWVAERYLAVPDSITPRMRELAAEIASDHENTFDIVAGITRFLRFSITYSEVITDTPPEDQDPLDWFLFDSRVGFCNYYASSQVVLLRSLGIPARLAVGFAEGEHRSGTNTYLVYERNAHAWPEVYFPGFGWVEFEPTASEDPIVRPLGDVDAEGGEFLVPSGRDYEEMMQERLDRLEGMDEIAPGEGLSAGSGSVLDRLGLPYLVLAFLLGCVLLVVAWRARRRRAFRALPVFLERGFLRLGWEPPPFLHRWVKRASLSPLQRAYMEVDQALMRLNASPASAATPAERTANLASVLPLATEPAYQLLAEYQTATYSPHVYSIVTAREAARSIRKLSWRAKLRRLLGRV